MAPLSLRRLGIGAASLLALLLAACGGGDSSEATPTPDLIAGATPVPTASPLATVPVPTILDGSTSGGATDEPQDVTYVVVAGDSLSAIATRFDTTIDAIMEANDLGSVDIFVGQELTIPGAASGSTPATPTPRPSTGGVQTYVVQPGDTAFGIALEFDTTLEELAAANGISVDDLTNLQVGQELQIPG
jgi:LysM repeat protein